MTDLDKRGFEITLEGIHDDLMRHATKELFDVAREKGRAIFLVFDEGSNMPGLSSGINLADASHMFRIFSEAIWRTR